MPVERRALLRFMSRKAPNHDARQAILALEPDEPVFEDYERQDIDAWPVRNEIAPVCPIGRGERRPDNLEIFGAISIGADDQRRAAVKAGWCSTSYWTPDWRAAISVGSALGTERSMSHASDVS